MDYELTYPKSKGREHCLRIFHKKSHNCNVGNSSKLSKHIVIDLLNTLTPLYESYKPELTIFPDCRHDDKLQQFWLRRCYYNEDDLKNKEIILLSINHDISYGGYWYGVCIYDTERHIYKFRSLLKWNKLPDEYKEKKKLKISLDDDFYIDYSNYEGEKYWWVELKNRLIT